MHLARGQPSATLQTAGHAYSTRRRELSISLQTRDVHSVPRAYMSVYLFKHEISRLPVGDHPSNAYAGHATRPLPPTCTAVQTKWIYCTYIRARKLCVRALKDRSLDVLQSATRRKMESESLFPADSLTLPVSLL